MGNYMAPLVGLFRIHLVATHFVPTSVGQPPASARETRSVLVSLLHSVLEPGRLLTSV